MTTYLIVPTLTAPEEEPASLGMQNIGAVGDVASPELAAPPPEIELEGFVGSAEASQGTSTGYSMGSGGSAGAAGPLGTSSGTAVGHAEILHSASVGRRERLGQRTVQLTTIANLLHYGGVAGMAGAADDTDQLDAMSDDTAIGFAELALPDNMKLLPGVGAIVVTDADDSLKSRVGDMEGVRIFENIEIRLPSPVSTVQNSDHNAGDTLSDRWHLDKIGLEEGHSGGAGILIGILDTGIDAAHPEFAGKTVHFMEFDRNGNAISHVARDAGDHGTHVSSIAAGRDYGVAPDAELAVAAVLTNWSPKGMFGYLVQISSGLDWLISQEFRDGETGVDIVNASLGGKGFNTYLSSAVQGGLEAGIPLVAAIGNSGRDGVGNHGSPGNYSDTLGVGASDHSDTVAEFSDWADGGPPAGPRYPVPDLSAPGVAVNAAVPGGRYERMNGTSMAAPVVTGVAARRMSENPSLHRNPAALFQSLLSGLAPVQRRGANGNKGGRGRIKA